MTVANGSVGRHNVGQGRAHRNEDKVGQPRHAHGIAIGSRRRIDDQQVTLIAPDDLAQFVGLDALNVVGAASRLLPSKRGALVEVSIAQEASHAASASSDQQMNG
jgi:hypothetical protein